MKVNPWTAHKTELAKVKAELAAEKEKPMLQMFAERLGQAMLVQLASQPYTEWPQFAKNTFAWVATDSPTSAWLYKKRLPKS